MNPIEFSFGVDLAILGQEAEVYGHYAPATRSKYAHVPQAAYQAHRGRALELLHAKALANQLYCHCYFAQQYQDRAVSNISRELAALRAVSTA